ncbi:hypothetical protein GOODEAATRI_028408 [Goodea atripinnis]|uniref:Uncharacterized protein n=1 Tax=Goodea atripinnis TaxID=208336 RepID=A0ABV0Q1S9_9TELE
MFNIKEYKETLATSLTLHNTTWCQKTSEDGEVPTSKAFDFSWPEQWPEWRQRFQRYRVATKLNLEDGAIQGYLTKRCPRTAMGLIKHMEEIRASTQIGDSCPNDIGRLKIKPIKITLRQFPIV